jgi:hypothetical protein
MAGEWWWPLAWWGSFFLFLFFLDSLAWWVGPACRSKRNGRPAAGQHGRMGKMLWSWRVPKRTLLSGLFKRDGSLPVLLPAMLPAGRQSCRLWAAAQLQASHEDNAMA